MCSSDLTVSPALRQVTEQRTEVSDPRIIELAQELALRNGRGPESFEYQMFHGVRPLEQRRLADIGLRCRTYIPFGPGWYGYLATRMAARPRILFSYARALFDKR